MKIWTLIKVLCVALLPVMTSGCGFVFTHGPPVGHEQMEYFSCTENNAGPIIDIVWAGLNGLGAFAIASDPDAYRNSGLAIGSGVAWAAFSGAAAVTGLGKTKKCKAARQELATRQAQLREVGRDPQPIPSDLVVQAVVVRPSADTVSVGEQIQLVATAMNSGGAAIPNQSFRWSSSNDAIASVGRAGLVTAHASGTVVVAANSDDVVGTVSIVVLPRP